MRTALCVAFIIVLALGSLVAGCSSGEHRNRKVSDSDRYATGNEREDWNRTHFDPVCNHPVDPKTAPYQDAYLGQRYYFDTEECWRRFHDNPSACLPAYEEGPRARDVR